MSVDVVCPMPGTILQILVKVGDVVQPDDELFIMEAMKMEVPVCAPGEGCVREILVLEKDAVSPDQIVIVLE
jgi:biotin carboxyl carrier protein